MIAEAATAGAWHSARGQKVAPYLITYQLEHPKSAGLSFVELYQAARQKYLATSEGALKRHIKEFTTHDLVRTKNGLGGTPVYYCHFPRETLTALAGSTGSR